MEKPPPAAHTRILAVERIAAIAAVFAFALLTLGDNKADVDLWGNVGFVWTLPWQEGFHRVNTYAYTAPEHPWVNHEWGTEYLMHHAWRIAGSAGLLLWKLTLGAGVLALILAAMRREGVTGPTRFLLLLLILSTMGYGFSIRPHHATFLAEAAMLFLLVHARPPRRTWWPYAGAALAGCIWGNLHGAFFAGIVILLVYALGAALDRRAGRTTVLAPAAALVCAAAFFAGSLVNPYGFSLWNFIRESAGHVRPYLSEWAPFHLIRHGVDHADFLFLTPLAVAAIAFARPVSWVRALLLGAALASALLLRRNIPVFALAAGLLAAGPLHRLAGPSIDGLVGRLPAGFRIACCVALAALSLGFAAFRGKVDPLRVEVPLDAFPVDAVRFLAEHDVRANAFVFFDWAEQVIWHLHPQIRVFLDGRFRSAYPEEVVRAYFDFLYSERPDMDMLDRTGTDMLFVHLGNPCTAAMLRNPAWQTVYVSDTAVILLRRDAHPEWADREPQRAAPLRAAFFP